MTDTLAGKHLGIVVTTAPERGDFERAERMARSARARNIEVSLFLMDEAVIWGAHHRAEALVEEGCDVVLCSTNAAGRSVVAAPGVLVGSQDDHAAIVHRADRVVAFT